MQSIQRYCWSGGRLLFPKVRRKWRGKAEKAAAAAQYEKVLAEHEKLEAEYEYLFASNMFQNEADWYSHVQGTNFTNPLVHPGVHKAEVERGEMLLNEVILEI